MFRHEFAKLAIFDGMDPEEVRELSPFLDEIVLREGETVFKQGEPACCLFILLEGEVAVRYKPYDGPVLTVSRIQAGEVFGWSAALGRQVYTSSAEVVRSGLAYCIHAANLQRLCACSPKAGEILLERLADSIAERLRNTNSSVLDLLTQGMDTKVNGSNRSGCDE